LMDGYRLLAHIRSVRPTMPVLLMSGHLDGGRDAEATRAGAFAILHKPLDRDVLISQLQLALQRTSGDRGDDTTP
jgi:DNA-binding NtrC family response regulator